MLEFKLNHVCEKGHMCTDTLAHSVTSSSTAMLLAMQDEQIINFREKGFQLLVTSDRWLW